MVLLSPILFPTHTFEGRSGLIVNYDATAKKSIDATRLIARSRDVPYRFFFAPSQRFSLYYCCCCCYCGCCGRCDYCGGVVLTGLVVVIVVVVPAYPRGNHTVARPWITNCADCGCGGSRLFRVVVGRW